VTDPARSDGERRLLALIEHGHRLLERERAALFAGRFDAVAGIAEEKAGLLDGLERAISGTRGTRRARGALEELIADSRRNERLIGAALGGLRAARRSIRAILATRQGDVAYAPDGSRITSRADAVRNSSRA